MDEDQIKINTMYLVRNLKIGPWQPPGYTVWKTPKFRSFTGTGQILMSNVNSRRVAYISLYRIMCSVGDVI